MFAEFQRFVSDTEAFQILVKGGDILVEIRGDQIVLSGVRDTRNLAHFCEGNLDPQNLRPATFWAKGEKSSENDFPGDREYPTMTGHF